MPDPKEASKKAAQIRNFLVSEWPDKRESSWHPLPSKIADQKMNGGLLNFKTRRG
jgi:hypothetical protein